jgi:hypothetical protein
MQYIKTAVGENDLPARLAQFVGQRGYFRQCFYF